MRILFTLLIFFSAVVVLPQSVRAQYYIKGRVVQDKNGEPIAGASVFISNSTKGTTSKPDGSFELNDVPAGNHELIVSSIGYSTLAYAYTASQLPLKLEVRLEQKASELETVVVEPDEEQGWKRWGKFFVDNFIGTSMNASDCKLLNPQVLRFKRSRKDNILTVIADEPLIIENKALGYKIKYQLEEFSYDFNNKYLLFLGYPFFEDMTGKERQKDRWAAARKKAYHGSIHHFMKSLYHNQLAAEGFELRRMIVEENTEKKRVRAQIRSNMDAQRAKGQTPVIDFGDSSKYYSQVLQQADQFERVLPQLLNADSVLATTGSAEKTFFFEEYLHITYKKEKEENGYASAFYMGRAAGPQRSWIALPSLNPITIDSTGNFSPILAMVCFGYWSWSEKMANTLPLDYKK